METKIAGDRRQKMAIKYFSRTLLRKTWSQCFGLYVKMFEENKRILNFSSNALKIIKATS